MIPLLSISAADIAALSDTHLRELVALLGRLEMRRAGYSATCVRAGGNQDAPDGGIDVDVETPASLPQGGHLARARVGLQVKRPAMGPAAIAAEMRPDDVLRPLIAELVGAGGAYVIVSSGSAVTGTARDERVAAMRAAVGADDPEQRLHLDFLGQDEIAAWTNDHAGAVMWVKSRLGSAPSGWQAYGRWSRAPAADEAFFTDADTKLLVEEGGDERELPLLEGLERVRSRLEQRGRVARLVGLSGTGKTRFAEAVFDPDVGVGALSGDDVLYTDIGADPQPSPLALIEQLKAVGSDVVVIVDNCPPALHNLLAQAVLASGSRLRLLTIEYDVRADQPEETDVFRLVGLSGSVVELLLQSRYPHLSAVDRARLAEISDGNARVALALADALGRDVDTSSLSNDELINRLFHQRHQPDAGLLAAAQTVSIVYSFDGEDVADESELAALAHLGGVSSADLFGRVADLADRDLVQSRSRWRAFLPHPLANHLAKRKLDRTPDSQLMAFLVAAPARLGTSFCRRLGYLHDHPRAAALSARIIGEMGEDSEANRTRLEYLAPAAPDAALARLEALVASGSGADFAFRGNLTGLIHQLAYDAERFERSVDLLLAWKRRTRERGAWRDGDTFKGLFWLHLSGTQAPVELRIRVAQRLAASSDPDDQQDGLNALRELLHTGYFSSGRGFRFGMRRRDFGWQPETYGDTADWYRAGIAFAGRLAERGDEVGERAKEILASELPSLLAVPFVGDDALAMVRRLFDAGYWPAGWRALRAALACDEGLPEAIRANVRAFLQERAPATLEERLDVVAGAAEWSSHDLVDDEDDNGPDAVAVQDGSDAVRRYHRANAAATALGEELAADEIVRARVLPRLAAGQFGRAVQLGAGLMQGAATPREMWEQLTNTFRTAPQAIADASALRGAIPIFRTRDAQGAEAALDAAGSDPLLSPVLPMLQRDGGVDDGSIDRLLAALSSGLTPIHRFRALIGVTADGNLQAERISELAIAISRVDGGHAIAVEIVLAALRFGRSAPSSSLLRAGAELLATNPFTAHPNNMEVHKFSDLAELVLRSDDHADQSYRLIESLVRARRAQRAYGHEWRKYAYAIIRARPGRALDVLLLDGELSETLDDFFREGYRRRDDVLRDIDMDAVFAWVDHDPARRRAVLAKFAPLMALPANDPADEVELPRLHPIIQRLVDSAQDKGPVLAAIAGNIDPVGGWSGSRAAILQRRREGIATLLTHEHPEVRAWAETTLRDLDPRIARAVEWEGRSDRREQRFE